MAVEPNESNNDQKKITIKKFTPSELASAVLKDGMQIRECVTNNSTRTRIIIGDHIPILSLDEVRVTINTGERFNTRPTADINLGNLPEEDAQAIINYSEKKTQLWNQYIRDMKMNVNNIIPLLVTIKEVKHEDKETGTTTITKVKKPLDKMYLQSQLILNKETGTTFFNMVRAMEMWKGGNVNEFSASMDYAYKNPKKFNNIQEVINECERSFIGNVDIDISNTFTFTKHNMSTLKSSILVISVKSKVEKKNIHKEFLLRGLTAEQRAVFGMEGASSTEQPTVSMTTQSRMMGKTMTKMKTITNKTIIKRLN